MQVDIDEWGNVVLIPENGIDAHVLGSLFARGKKPLITANLSKYPKLMAEMYAKPNEG